MSTERVSQRPVGSTTTTSVGCEGRVYDGIVLQPSMFFAGWTGRRILDVGCGSGRLGGLLEQQGNACHGITISAGEAEQARRHITSAMLADVEVLATLPFPEQHFDAVILADVLEHVRNPQQVLQLVKPYLKPDADVVVSMPNVANFKVRLALLLGKFEYTERGIMDETHVKLYTQRSARMLLESAGYEVQCIRYTHWNWLWPRWLRRMCFGYDWEIRERLTRWFPGLMATQCVFYAKVSS